jgi:hypothetical protein
MRDRRRNVIGAVVRVLEEVGKLTVRFREYCSLAPTYSPFVPDLLWTEGICGEEATLRLGRGLSLVEWEYVCSRSLASAAIPEEIS